MNTTIQTSIKPQNSPTSGKRFAIALASWCLAGIGVLSSFIFAGTALTVDWSTVASGLAVTPVLAWICLAVMTVRWVQGYRCHWLWPMLGSVFGITSAFMFAWVFYVYVAAVPLAIYLVFWHLVSNFHSKNAC